jgi:hypothetical protein
VIVQILSLRLACPLVHATFSSYCSTPSLLCCMRYKMRSSQNTCPLKRHVWAAGLCVDGWVAWTQARASGKSPADLAIAAGHSTTHERVFEQLRATIAARMKGKD